MNILTVLGSPLGRTWVLSLFAAAMTALILRRIAVERSAPDEAAARKARRAERRKRRRERRQR